MLNIIIPSICVAVMLGAARQVWKSSWASAQKRKVFGRRPETSDEQLLEWVKRYGSNSNSFMTLYPGFEYFRSENPDLEGYIGFIDTSRVWVVGAEPVCASENQTLLLQEFCEAAASAGKSVVLLPVNQDFVRKHRDLGFKPLMIGSEPIFLLDRYPRTGKTWIDVVPTAKTFAAKGAKVSRLDPEKISREMRDRLEKMTSEWLGSRKTSELGFLNQVIPWFLTSEKRYFSIESGSKETGFLAAIPVPAKNGWYLIDLIRAQNSPAGSTELLLLQAMKLLREEGAEFVTLGVAPLSELGRVFQIPESDFRDHQKLYRLLRFIFEKGNWMYNFSSLFQYKLKFEPTRIDPAFLAYRDRLGRKKSMGLMDTLSVFEAFLPSGLTHATLSGVTRTFKRFDLSTSIKGLLDPGTVVKSVPPNWIRLFSRCKVTATLILLNTLVYFITTSGSGRLDAETETRWSYSWPTLIESPIHALLSSPFLHWNLLHFNLNLISLFLFTGTLEYLAGSGITLAAFIVPALLSNPLTSLIQIGLHTGQTATESDIGASLGIFGTAGALSCFMKRGRILLLALAIVTGCEAVLLHKFLVLDHWIALALGLAVAKVWFFKTWFR